MAKRTYVANAPLVAQVDRIEITADQYPLGKIAEGSDLTATINDKTITASVQYIEGGSRPNHTSIDDGNAVRSLLQDFADKWNESTIPEFAEIECSEPAQNDNDDWFVDLTARVPGVPFVVDVESTHPVIDVDTIQHGGEFVGEVTVEVTAEGGGAAVGSEVAGDTFAGSDGTLLSSHTSDGPDSATWSMWATGDSDPVRSGGKLCARHDSGFTPRAVLSGTYGGAVDLSADIAFSGSLGAGGIVRNGFVLRGSSSTSHLFAYLQIQAVGTSRLSKLQIWKIDSSDVVLLGEVDAPTVRAAAEAGAFTGEMSIAAVGSSIVFDVMGDVLEVSSGFNTSSGKVGVVASYYGASGASNGDLSPLKMDNLSVAGTTVANETLSIYTNATGGTFTLAFDGTDSDPIAFSASAAEIETALDDLVGGTWTVTGTGTEADPWEASAGGALAGTDVAAITGDGTGLTGEAPREKWSVSLYGATGGTFVLSFRDHETTAIAYGASAATVQAALDALDNLDGVSVTGAGSVADPYIIEVLDVDYADTNLRQLIAWNEGLTGTAYPVVAHETITAADGPWHWTSSLNWWNPATSAYGVPVDGDDLFFEMGSDSRCPRYGIDQSELTVAGLTFLANFTDNATVGLPRWNPLGYWEYRETVLKINLSGDGPITVGSRGGGGSPLMNFNTFDSKTTFRIHNTASPIAGESSAIQWEGTHAENTVEILGGFFGAAPYAGQVATLAKITQRDGSVLTGAGCTIGDIDKTSGDLLIDRSTVEGLVDIQG